MNAASPENGENNYYLPRFRTEITYPVVEHPDDGGTLEVRDDVEDLLHLAGVPDLHLDVVGCNIVITDY